MDRLHSISPALFLSIFIHSILIFMLLATLAHHTYAKKKLPRSSAHPIHMRQHRNIHQTPAPQATTTQQQQPTHAHAQQTNNLSPSPSIAPDQQPEKPLKSGERTPQELSIPRPRQQQHNVSEALHTQKQNPGKRPRHAWHKYHQPPSSASTTNSSTTTPPTLNQLFKAGIDAVHHEPPKKSAQERATDAVAQSFMRDILTEYKQEIARALLYALNRQRIIAAPANQPPKVIFSIVISRKGIIHSPELIHAHITNSAMRKFVDDILAALCHVAPIRPFPSQITEDKLTLPFSIINLGPRDNPYSDPIPTLTRFTLSS